MRSYNGEGGFLPLRGPAPGMAPALCMQHALPSQHAAGRVNFTLR